MQALSRSQTLMKHTQNVSNAAYEWFVSHNKSVYVRVAAPDFLCVYVCVGVYLFIHKRISFNNNEFLAIKVALMRKANK